MRRNGCSARSLSVCDRSAAGGGLRSDLDADCREGRSHVVAQNRRWTRVNSAVSVAPKRCHRPCAEPAAASSSRSRPCRSGVRFVELVRPGTRCRACSSGGCAVASSSACCCACQCSVQPRRSTSSVSAASAGRRQRAVARDRQRVDLAPGLVAHELAQLDASTGSRPRRRSACRRARRRPSRCAGGAAPRAQAAPEGLAELVGGELVQVVGIAGGEDVAVGSGDREQPARAQTRRSSSSTRSGSATCSIISKQTTRSNSAASYGSAVTSPTSRRTPCGMVGAMAAITRSSLSMPTTSLAPASASMRDPYAAPQPASSARLPPANWLAQA